MAESNETEKGSIDIALQKFLKMSQERFSNYQPKNMGELLAKRLWEEATSDEAPARLLQSLIERIDGKVAPKAKSMVDSAAKIDAADKIASILGGKK